jgi:hypothetical protein
MQTALELYSALERSQQQNDRLVEENEILRQANQQRYLANCDQQQRIQQLEEQVRLTVLQQQPAPIPQRVDYFTSANVFRSEQLS